jgi:hypothetical protein
MLPAKEKKVIFKRMRQSGSSAKQAKRTGPATAMEREKARAKAKRNPAEIGIGKEKGTLVNHLAPTIAKEMAIASGETTVVSPTMGLKVASGRQRLWQPKSPRMSMLVKVLDEVEGKEEKPKEKQASAKDRLMQIVQGQGRLVGVVTADDERNYVPSRPKPTVRTVMMIGGPGPDAREYTPVDPARAGRSGDVQSEADKERSQNEKVYDEKVNDEKDFGKVNVNFTLCQSDLEKGPVEPVAAQKGEDRVWGYNNFGMRDSPIAREAAFEPGFERRSKAEAEPEGHGGRWKPDEKKKASKRAEKKRGKAEEKQNKNKTKISQPHPNESRPL